MAKSHRIEVPPRNTSASVRIPATRSTPKKPSGVLSERHTSAQDPLYQSWIMEGSLLEVTFNDGETLKAYLRGYDTYALSLMAEDDQDMLVFKQGVRLIRPCP